MKVVLWIAAVFVALAVYIVATYCAVKEHKELATARLANAEDSVYRARRRRFIWRAGSCSCCYNI